MTTTLDTDAARFLAQVRLAVTPTTYVRKRNELEGFLRHCIAKRKHYTAATKDDIERYLLARPRTRARRLQITCTLRDFYRFLGFEPPANPAADITFLPAKVQRLPHVPGKAAVKRSIAGLTADGTEMALRNRLMAELAYGSGLRRAELRKLDIEDIDLEESVAHVAGKGGKDRTVPLTATAVAILREYLALRRAHRGPLLVAATGRRLSLQRTYEVFRDKAGIRPHLMRHACATHMLKNGCNLRIIQELLGHSRLTTAQIYTHIEKNDLRAVIDRMHPRKSNRFLT
ncbi:MAG: tyrosine-type recombinase/integrase [Chitinivibrionales bacterium]|nr:tyrosine-type recombinase/integrase [Chitinivibrionales bacterium]MBD3355949.1 tyrosine-type recombinase/integrase [Chitinivibrionales bacterium]